MLNKPCATSVLFHKEDLNIPTSVLSARRNRSDEEYKKAWLKQIKYCLGDRILEWQEPYLAYITPIVKTKISPISIPGPKIIDTIDSLFEEPTSIRLELIGSSLKTWIIIREEDLK